MRRKPKDLWADADHYVEIWPEKARPVGVVEPVTAKYLTPLMVASRYSSLSFLYGAAETITSIGNPLTSAIWGTTSGVNAGEKGEEGRGRWEPTSYSLASPSPPSRSLPRRCRLGRPRPATPAAGLGRRQPQRGIGRHQACHAGGIVQDAIERHTPAKAYARLLKPRQAKLWRR
jgi:hypothetical protein